MTAKPKTQLRNDARTKRADLARAHPDFAQAIARFANDLPIAKNAIVAGYWPIRDEADPRTLMAALARRGHTLALPRVEKGSALTFHAWREGDVTHRNAYGIDEPHVSATIITPGAVLVPLLAFDPSGHRLGYGGGYYDRTLAAMRASGTVRAIGIAHAGQEISAFPHEPHDHPLDAVLTEKGYRAFTTRRE
ncbi:MAG TPA: 5-formyltetrahydrofolate cyclo-ligase [Rhizomicrobium sp.]|jgi:5-formyltetrahydrofolate cyclo-ligase|nr:5-formyltetrahydrofolate cyclo-ligase [Rhizomicrobium sp.]